MGNFSKFYTSCTLAEQALVDDPFFNVMSYHLPDTKDQVEDRMTELQLDLHADTANSPRASFVIGSTVFVRTFVLPFLENGSCRFPFDTVAEGVSAANASPFVRRAPAGRPSENLETCEPLLRVDSPTPKAV